MFSGIVSNLRGLAQSVVRGAASIGRSLDQTFDTLVETGLDYARSQFALDFEQYNVQSGICDFIRSQPKDRLIPGSAHVETEFIKTTKFKYDFKMEYENLKGEVSEHHWSVISNDRMSQVELDSIIEEFAEEYAPDGFPVHGAPQIVGSWVRAEIE